jgi:hypothetical protein
MIVMSNRNIVGIMLIAKPNLKFKVISRMVLLLKMRLLNKCIRMKYLKKISKYGIYKIKIFTDRKYGKLKEIDFNKNIKFNWKKYLVN